MKMKYVFLFAACLLVLSSCGSADEKKMKFMDRGMALLEKGDHVRARIELKNAIQIDPKFSKAYQILGKLELKLKNYREAYGYFMKAADLDPEDMESQLTLAKILLGAGEVEKAEDKITLVLEKSPDSIEAMKVKSALLMRKGEPGAALASIDEIMKKGVKDPEVHLLLASAYGQQGRRDHALEVLKSGALLNPASPSLRVARLNIYMAAGQMRDAEETLRGMIDDWPDKNAYRLMMAELYLRKDKRDSSEAILEDLVARDSENTAERLAVSRFCIDKGLFELAEKFLKDGIAMNPENAELHFMLGTLYLKNRKPVRSIAQMERILEIRKDPGDPERVPAKIGIAKARYVMGENSRAEKLIDEVLGDDPGNVDARLIKGRLYVARGDGVSAVPEFRGVVTDRPKFLGGYLGLARAHHLSGETELAMDTLKKALKIAPGSEELLMALVRTSMEKKDYKAAEKWLEKRVKANPESIRALSDLGDFLLSRKNPAGARGRYGDIITKAPANPLGYLKLSRAYVMEKRMDLALETLEKGNHEIPGSPLIVANLVRIHLRNKSYEKAEQLCLTSMSGEKKDAFYHHLLAGIHVEQKELNEAEKSLEKAISLYPGWSPPHNQLAKLFLVQGRKKEAVKRFEAAIHANPGNVPAYMSLGALHERSGEYQKAKDIYARALEKEPNLWSAANNLAFLSSETAKSEEELHKALELSQKALAMNPGGMEVLDTTGWIHFKLGAMERAYELLGAALEKAPESPVVNYHMGMVHYKSGRNDLARLMLGRALEGADGFLGKKEAERVYGLL